MADRMDTCATCRYFARWPGMTGTEGQCRRRPPVTVGSARETSNAGVVLDAHTFWPIVQTEDWCGEYEMKR